MQQNDSNTASSSGTFPPVDPYRMEPQAKKGLSTGRVLLIVFGALGACLIICVVAGFFLMRSVQSGFETVVDDGISAVMDDQVGGLGTAQPGTYVITTEAILAQLNAQLDSQGARIDDLFVQILPDNRIVLGITSDGQDLEYNATLAATDGRLEVTDIDASNGFLNFIAPGSKIANGLESGVNDYLEANGLRLTSLSTTDGELTLVLE